VIQDRLLIIAAAAGSAAMLEIARQGAVTLSF